MFMKGGDCVDGKEKVVAEFFSSRDCEEHLEIVGCGQCVGVGFSP